MTTPNLMPQTRNDVIHLAPNHRKPYVGFKDYYCFALDIRYGLIFNTVVILWYLPNYNYDHMLNAYELFTNLENIEQISWCLTIDQLSPDGDWSMLYTTYHFSLMMSNQWRYQSALNPLLMQWFPHIWVHAMAALVLGNVHTLGMIW